MVMLLLQLLMLLPAGGGLSHPAAGTFEPRLAPSFTFSDDGDRESLLSSLTVHRSYIAGLPTNYSTTIHGGRYSRDQLLASIDGFISLLEQNISLQELSRQLLQHFTVIEARGRRGSGEMLVTGYYEPLFGGSLNSTPPYLYPLYQTPKNLVKQQDPPSGKMRVGRLDNHGRLLPFWTREEIEGSEKPLAGSELVYLRDPFEVFLLHIQGSGRIVLPDGTVRPVRFANHNGHAYHSIGKLLVDEGKMTLEESSIPAIRRYFSHHPFDLKRVLNHNPRYIFFTWGDDEVPKGSLGLPLTPGRSVAIDRRALPDTLFGWLETSVPVLDEQGKIIDRRSSRRFVVPQDSGAAIRGPGRVDLFLGSGADAATTAGTMKEKGKLLFFVKKETPDR